MFSTNFRSATNRIEASGKANAEKMHSNASLLQLVQDTHSLLLPVTIAPKPPAVTSRASTNHHKIVPSGHSSLSMAVGDGSFPNNIHTMSPHYNCMAMMAASKVSDSSIPFRPPAMSQNLPTADGTASSYAAPKPKSIRELPAEILEINVRRESTGAKAFKEYQEKHSPPKAPSKPSFLTLEIPTTTQLHEGLTYLFRPLPQNTARQARLNRDDRKKEIVHWTQALDHLLDSSISDLNLSPSSSKMASQATQNEMVDLLVASSGSIEKSDDATRRLFCQGTERAGIYEVLISCRQCPSQSG
jgi:hypothetical protein